MEDDNNADESVEQGETQRTIERCVFKGEQKGIFVKTTDADSHPMVSGNSGVSSGGG